MFDSFLAAIRANPDDDIPRLIFADYLDERGDPRGEFIRIQTELAHGHPDDRQQDTLRARERALLTEHEEEWFGPLAEQLYRGWFHRGFLEVSLNIRDFLDDHEILELPSVVGIHLTPPSYMDAELVRGLVASSKCQRVRSLYLGFEWVRDAIAIAIAQAEDFPNLVALDLANNGITDFGATALAASGRLPGLRILALGNNLITDVGANALANAPARTHLRQLDLSNNEITSAGMRSLKRSPHLANLEELRLEGNPIRRSARIGEHRREQISRAG
ncbi:MAG: TIGR02996 domain-containing protein [Gemmataceae bacterium]